MPRNLSPEMLTRLSSPHIRPGYLVDLAFEGITLYYVTRNFDISWNGNNYFGSGLIHPISGFGESGELSPTGLTLTLSGTDTLISAVLQSISPKTQSTVRLALWDDNDQLILSPYEVFTGYIDVPVIKDDQDERLVELSLENDLIRLHRIPALRYSFTEQVHRFPTVNDWGFSFIHTLANREIVWGRSRRRKKKRRDREEGKSEFV